MKRAILLLVLPLAGCTLAPPIPLERDPDPNIAKLCKELPTSWDPPQLALAPVKSTYLKRHVVAPRAWTKPPLPQRGKELQERLQQVLRWGLHGRAEWPFVLEEVDDDTTEAICGAAEDAGAQLVAQLEIFSLQAAFVERELPWWPINAFLFWGIGIFPIVLVPDEEYKVAVEASFTIRDARTGEALFEFSNYTKEFSASFNDFQRGWSAESVFFLHEAFLVGDYEDFIAPFRNLWPHLQEKLLAEILDDLRQKLPKAVAESQQVLERGDPDQPRTYALIIASKNPPPPAGVAKEKRPHALAADEDAREFYEHMRESSTARQQDLFKVVDAKSAREEIQQALDTIGRRSRQHDRVIIYYSGFGTADAEGKPQLVLDDGLLPLRELRAWSQEKLRRNPNVALLLDTSFADWKERGRSYPGGGKPKKGFLSDLEADPDRWTILAAAQGDQVASSSPSDGGRGIFSLFLRSGLRTAADAEGNVNADTLYRYVTRGVRDYARVALPAPRDQTPVPGQETPAGPSWRWESRSERNSRETDQAQCRGRPIGRAEGGLPMNAQPRPDADAQRDDAAAKRDQKREVRLRGTRGAPHPLARLAERLGRAPGRTPGRTPGRRPLPDVFEQYLQDQITRARVTPPARSALLPSRDLLRAHRRRAHARRPDA